MRVPPADLNCVAYVCAEHNGQVTPVATAFLVQLKTAHNDAPVQHFYYWVTAEHVINNIERNPILRINRKTGSPLEWPTHKEQWRKTLRSDVCAIAFWVGNDTWSELDTHGIDTDIFIAPDQSLGPRSDIPKTGVPLTVALGDEVLFFGLFAQHYGYSRNLPIVRFGTIARIPTDEKIVIEIDQHPTKREIMAYLVEARSWGGQSGSPALWTNEFTFRPKDRPYRPEESFDQRLSGLLGLVSSHFDIRQRAEAKTLEAEISTRLNTGIAIIVPAHEILTLLVDDEVFQADRATHLAEDLPSRPG
jgi:hypothetical protein